MTKSKDRNPNARTISTLRKIANNSLCDIIVGPMHPNLVKHELDYALRTKKPEYMVLIMERKHNPEILQYQTSIYITRDDFKNVKR